MSARANKKSGQGFDLFDFLGLACLICDYLHPHRSFFFFFGIIIYVLIYMGRHVPWLTGTLFLSVIGLALAPTTTFQEDKGCT